MTQIILPFKPTRQPDYVSCGACSLHSVYRYWRIRRPLTDLISEVRPVPGGGTAAVMLALHAMQLGFDATIYTCSLPMFDPTWFEPGAAPIRDSLLRQAQVKQLDPKLQVVTEAYVEFLDAGGQVLMEDLTMDLLASLLARGAPLIMGLSSTWLYRCMRDRPNSIYRDDIAGEPTGHFVVVHGIDTVARQAWIADPYLQRPYPGTRAYQIDADRLIHSMLLGVSTYDAKLLVLSHTTNRPRYGQFCETEFAEATSR